MIRFTLRKTEKQRLIETLEQPHNTVGDAARAAWNTSLEEFLKREMWVVLVRDPGVGLFPHGPYPTANAAHAAIKSGDITGASRGATAAVVRLLSHELDAYYTSEGELF